MRCLGPAGANYSRAGRSVGAENALAAGGRNVVLVSVDGRAGAVIKMRQNPGWAVGYNTIALPIGAGVFEPGLGPTLRPEIAAVPMAGSSLIVAVNALILKRLRLPRPEVVTESVVSATPPSPGR